MANECTDCGDPPGPGSVVRLLGKDRKGGVIELCSRCWIRRDREANAPVLTLKEIKPKRKKR